MTQIQVLQARTPSGRDARDAGDGTPQRPQGRAKAGPADAGSRIPTRTRWPIALGVVTVLVAFAGFGGWAATAPLQSAAVASGHIVVETDHKAVAHMDGGIVSELLVRNGTSVRQGQVLLRLDDDERRALQDLLHGQLLAAYVRFARLEAERTDGGTIDFAGVVPQELANLPQAADIMAAEQALFATRAEMMASELAVLAERASALEQEIEGLTAQIASQDGMIETIDEEIADVEYLLATGNARRPRLLALVRGRASIEGDRGVAVADIGRSRRQIAEAQQEMTTVRARRIAEVNDAYRGTQDEIFNLTERLQLVQQTLSRLEIRAPQDGVVADLAVHAPGAVIRPGEPILTIVPVQDRLLVEAALSARDIDAVHVGLQAEIRLTAFSSRQTPPVPGEVVYVSPDLVATADGTAAFHLVRVAVSADALANLPGVTLYPGMPADVLVLTGERTALDAVLEPIVSAIWRSFREK
ncbi:MAG: HlyD family type I secretion periplasmic adaptor subunit [Rhodospirillaceae bacterium]|nr:HlyD family type I secretion periplasmic adaptor subunit [Rhodospirillaceae bacterium]